FHTTSSSAMGSTMLQPMLSIKLRAEPSRRRRLFCFMRLAIYSACSEPVTTTLGILGIRRLITKLYGIIAKMPFDHSTIETCFSRNLFLRCWAGALMVLFCRLEGVSQQSSVPEMTCIVELDIPTYSKFAWEAKRSGKMQVSVDVGEEGNPSVSVE